MANLKKTNHRQITKTESVLQKIVHDIVMIPEKLMDFSNDKTFTQLLSESGYFNVSSKIDESDILRVLNKNPSFMQSWLTLSDNKRTDSGWYIKCRDNNLYTVQFFPNKEMAKSLSTYDLEMACAFFIKKEIESISKKKE